MQRCHACKAAQAVVVDFPRVWMSLLRCDGPTPHFALVQEHLRNGQACIGLSGPAGERLAAVEP
jgi:hypothetical protein